MDVWQLRQLLETVFGFGLGFTVVLIVGRTIRTVIERRGTSPRELRDIAERLTRIEQAVDTMAVEMERIAEANRYTAKLLTDQREGSAQPARSIARVVTPH